VEQARRVGDMLHRIGMKYDATQIRFLYNRGLLETEPDRDFGTFPGQKERVIATVESALLGN
jgi:hypothetical protein